MKFENRLIHGTILKRYKRFLADIKLDENYQEYKKGDVITAHTANTGSMKTCWEENWKVLISHHNNPKRKLKFSLEMTNNESTWIGVNTALPNKLAVSAIEDGSIKELLGYENIKPEIKVGDSRIDILLYDGASPDQATRKCYVEVKNVTLLGSNGFALFPDSVSTRGQKHLRELTQIRENGDRACMLYIVQREDVHTFSPAGDIDPEYSQLLKQAHEKGVEILVYQCRLSEKEIAIDHSIPFKL